MPKRLLTAVFMLAMTLAILSSAHASHVKRTLAIPLQYDIIQLDPARLLDTDSVWVATQLFDGLFELTNTGDVSPRLVKSWRASPDGKTYSLTLKEGVAFSDGTPLTTKDVVYTFERLKRTSKREKPLLGKLTRMEVVDDRRIDLAFSTRVPNLPRILSAPSYFILPSRYAARIDDGSFFTVPVGTGPFIVKRWDRGRALILGRNPRYALGTVSLNEIRFVFADPARPWTKSEFYGFDMLLAMPAYSSNVPSGFASRWYNRPVVEFVGFNLGHPFWKDRENRRALAEFFDTQGYYRTLFEHRLKSWQRSDSIIPKGLLSQESEASARMKASPDAIMRVKRYLKDIVRQIYFVAHHHLSRERLQASLKKALGRYLNADAEAVVVTPEELIRGIAKGDIGFYVMRLVADTFDPYEILVYFSDDAPDDLTRHADPAFTATLRRARVEMDARDRAAAYAGLARELNDETVVIPIAGMFNERLFITSRCELQDFGPLGPWYYRMDKVVCR